MKEDLLEGEAKIEKMLKELKVSRITFAGDPEFRTKGIDDRQFVNLILFFMYADLLVYNNKFMVDVEGFNGKLKAIVHPASSIQGTMDADDWEGH